MPASITTAPPTWAPADAAQLREILGTPFGQRLARALLLATPSTTGWNAEIPAEYQLGRIAGYESFVGIFNELSDVTAATQQAATTGISSGTSPMYPDLDDETKWHPTS
jgi:hypothetical protein